ncbi:hypothetical protein LDENG_00203090 [Lucifuga dentata]|nr:hypothetical protein LDENG_00203090 [Lucifuga dentata]
MSFVRVGRSQHSKGKKPVRPKKATAPKREWVSTVNDLSLYKLTPEELSHRHEIHKSTNKVVAQWELREKALKRHFRRGGSPAPLDQTSLNIIREVFSDQLLLQDVVARSDRAMAVVKDLFGDAPHRQTGHPSVTMAPNSDPDSALPVLQRPDPPTQLSLLSQSMMDQQALNELEASEEDHSEDICPTGSSDYHVIHRSNIQKMKVKRGKVAQHQRVRDTVPVSPCTSGTALDQTALNATMAVEHVRSRQSPTEEGKEETSVAVSQVLNPELTHNRSGRISRCSAKTRKCVSRSSGLDGSSVSSLSGDHSSLGMLQAMLGQVEAELDSLSPDTVPESAQSPWQHRTQGLTGFSVALVSTLGRLVHLHKQREEEAQREAQERRRLEEELREQQGLVNALTAETMTLREESAALQAQLQQQTAAMEQKLDAVVLALGGLGLLGMHIEPPQDSDIIATVCQSAPFRERTQACVSPAVLLSPPQQKDSRTYSPVNQAVPLYHELPRLDVLHSCVHTCGSAASLSSLPLISLPSTSSQALTSDPLSSQLSQEVMLAEIAQLSRQNDLMRAQLSQPKGLGSEVGGSPSSSREQRGSSSSSTGRATPQSAGERRTSGSMNTQHVPDAEGGQLTPQASTHDTLSVSSVEQRLLELNRQSAAARSRLLELIEQQKQSVSAKVSPSVSPIPPSAFSPHSAGGEGTPKVSMLVPAQDPLSHAGGGDGQYASSEMFASQSLGGEIRNDKTQADRQREREGWFALSTHVASDIAA